MKSPRALLAAAAAIAVLSGCDIPTGPPIIHQDWVVEVDETSLAGDQLLPNAVTVAGDNFAVSLDPVGATEALGALCGSACETLNGTIASVPAFEGDFTAAQALPDDVVSIGPLAGGSIDVAITNGFTFDPLENGGTIVITITDDATGAALGQVVLDDATGDILLPGTTATRALQLTSGSVTGALRATTSVNAPGGQVAFIDTSDLLEVTATVTTLLASAVVVDVGNRPVTFDDRDVDFEEVSAKITDRIVSGAVILEVTNPFGVAIDGQIDIGTISKSFSIDGSSSSTVTMPYTDNELRSFIGQPNVTLSGSGTASGTAVTIQPGQEMPIGAKLAITIEFG